MRTQGYFKHEEDGRLNSNVSLTELGQCEFVRYKQSPDTVFISTSRPKTNSNNGETLLAEAENRMQSRCSFITG